MFLRPSTGQFHRDSLFQQPASETRWKHFPGLCTPVARLVDAAGDDCLVVVLKRDSIDLPGDAVYPRSMSRQRPRQLLGRAGDDSHDCGPGYDFANGVGTDTGWLRVHFNTFLHGVANLVVYDIRTVHQKPSLRWRAQPLPLNVGCLWSTMDRRRVIRAAGGGGGGSNDTCNTALWFC